MSKFNLPGELHNIFNSIINSTSASKQLAELHEETLNALAENEDKDSPEWQINYWLGRLALLYGVPLNYLVVDEGLLPQESIKFFYLDNNWISALLNGAYSIGSSTINEQAHDKCAANSIFNSSHNKIPKIRGALFKKRSATATAHKSSYKLHKATITGFLLRSEAVNHWPGLEVEATGINQDGVQSDLELLRLEHLTPDILLCLFDGDLDTVKIHQPAEAIHFGFKLGEGGNFTKTLSKDDGNEDSSKEIPITRDFYRLTEEKQVINGVVNIEKLVTEMTSRIKSAKNQLKSDEFAMQMVVGIDTACLTKIK